MKYFKEQKCSFNYPVVAMGTFDGIHLGHRKLLSRLKETARGKNGEAVVITYYHHPLETIHRKTFPYLLTEKSKKEELLRNLGIDCVLYLKFDKQMAEMEAEDFISRILIGELGAKEIIAGYDTHFGKLRKGNYRFLQENEDRYNYRVEVVDALKIGNRIVSSSLIRDLVREGDMIDARKYLGRRYSLLGIVESGHRIGRKIGFPTINIRPTDEHKLIPAIGVYICETLVDGRKYRSLTNVGYSPTLKRDRIKEVETFLFDFQGDLYQQNVELIFHKRLRDELRFENASRLVQAIRQDVKKADKYFANKRNAIGR